MLHESFSGERDINLADSAAYWQMWILSEQVSIQRCSLSLGCNCMGTSDFTFSLALIHKCWTHFVLSKWRFFLSIRHNDVGNIMASVLSAVCHKSQQNLTCNLYQVSSVPSFSHRRQQCSCWYHCACILGGRFEEEFIPCARLNIKFLWFQCTDDMWTSKEREVRSMGSEAFYLHTFCYVNYGKIE